MANPYTIFLLSTACINMFLAVYALHYIKSRGILAYSILLTAISIYAFGYAFEIQSTNLKQIVFWLRIEYLGISFLPTLLFILAAQYTGKSNLLKPWLVILMLLFSICTLLLQMTNTGNLYYREMNLSYEAPFPVADFVKGPWYWIQQGYTNLMLMISCFLYYLMIGKSYGNDRIRAYIMFFILVLPWCTYVIYLSGISPYHIDLNPFSFSIVGILGALGMFRYNLLDYVPVALQHVFDSMADGVVVVDSKRCLVSFNPSAAVILPDLKSLQIGKSADQVFSSWPALSKLSHDFVSDIDVTRNGTTSYYHLRVVEVNTDKAKPGGWAIVFANITERKLKENKLLDIEKKLKELNADKDKFLAIIAHDLRNSFHLIINMADIVLSNIKKDNKAVALSKGKIILDTAASTYSLLQNLLEWALIQQQGKPFKIRSLNLALLAGNELVNLKPHADQKKLKINCNIDPHLSAQADEEMLKIIFRNLISNAIKYCHTGGIIDISAHAEDGRVIKVAVSDNGVGMTAEELNRLFKIDSHFSKKGTASENGTGLGLKLCKEFILLHGGDIWVNSTPGEGSTFTFTVPVGNGEEDNIQ